MGKILQNPTNPIQESQSATSSYVQERTNRETSFDKDSAIYARRDERGRMGGGGGRERPGIGGDGLTNILLEGGGEREGEERGWLATTQ